VGLFDTVTSRYPLPHHQDSVFQTKDLAAVVHGEHMIGGLMEEYEITAEGTLRRHAHEYETARDESRPVRISMKSIRDWWEDVPHAHGDIRIYTSEDREGHSSGRSSGSDSRTAASRM
jgi:hypothetical protein